MNDAETRTCFARQLMDDETQVEIGFDPEENGGYFALYNPAWTHIKEGQKGTVTFDFGEEKFAGDAFGRYRDDVPGGYAFFNNPAFVEAFARRQTVRVSGSNGKSYALDLTGTARAVSAVRECQKEQASAE